MSIETNLTKKYIFTRKLAGKPVVISFMTHQDIVDAIKILCEYKILRRTNRGMINTVYREYRILYDIRIHNWAGPGICVNIYRSHFLDQHVLRYEDEHNLIPNE